MEEETINRIETTARSFAMVLVTLVGLQTLFGALETQWGTLATFVSMCAVSVAWQSSLLRAVLRRRPKLFVVVLSISAVAMTLSVMACLPGSRA
ncbi:hypothetical protein ACN9MB_13430 [Dyella kyungheensis]|uniref:hypothetical protein n=1 Tax=Dyella kyungheensis TaxID=1242174 RepID=UPI003CF6C986